MPGVVDKAELRKAIKSSPHLPEEIVDLVCQGQEGSTDVLTIWWNALGITIGSMELAYRRGYQTGYEDAKAGKKYQEVKGKGN